MQGALIRTGMKTCLSLPSSLLPQAEQALLGVHGQGIAGHGLSSISAINAVLHHPLHW